MSSKERSVLTFSIVMMATLLLSACTQSLSSAPEATPTLIPTGLFVSPVASVENPMEMIEQFAKQTEAAQTAAGTPGTPGTPQAAVTGTPGTPGPEIVTATPSATVSVSTPTNANSAAVTSAPASTVAAQSTPIPAGSRPNEYILRDGEYPYCIARRYNVDPEALLNASGLTSPDIYYAGLKLIIPQGAAGFPGARALKTHPASYQVASGGETIYSIACLFGDVDPGAILSSNPSITASSTLTVGQTLQIP